jgi:hypothetical protein
VPQPQSSGGATNVAAAAAIVSSTGNVAAVASAASTGAKRSIGEVMVALPETENPTKRIVESYNLQRQRSAGTNLEDIVCEAYHNKHFKSDGGWSFTTIMRDMRFKDNAKFKRCLELLDVAATDEHKRRLEGTGLDATALMNAANSVASAAMNKLLELEEKPQAGKQTRGYTGVGARVTKVMTTKLFIPSVTLRRRKLRQRPDIEDLHPQVAVPGVMSGH